MKIIQFTAENIKKLVAVQITPDGNMVQITGKNGQGKTSVLDSIFWALAGTDAIQKQPIRKGADKAKIELKLGSGKTVELIVERTFTEKASYLTVKTADGAKYPSPQRMLDDLLGALTFDPLDFMRRDGKEQFEVLKGLVDLGIDLEELAKADKFDRERRTEVGREAKAKRAQAQGINVPDGTPDELVDEKALLDALAGASQHNADIERRKANREQAVRDIAAAQELATSTAASLPSTIRDLESARDKVIIDLQEQIERLNRKIHDANDEAAEKIEKARAASAAAVKEAEAKAADLQTKLDNAPALPEPIDIAAARQAVESAQATNVAVVAKTRRAKIEAEAKALDDEWEALTKALEARATQRSDALSAAKMPVEGLGFGDGIVTMNGLPLEQASDAEQLMISTAIAAAINPKLRVIRIRDGSLLDDDAMKRLAAFADERDMQVWVERVDSSGTVGIVMEDGHIKGAQPALEAAE